MFARMPYQSKKCPHAHFHHVSTTAARFVGTIETTTVSKSNSNLEAAKSIKGLRDISNDERYHYYTILRDVYTSIS